MPFPNNLPHELTSFVGRRREMVDLGRLLPTARLLTLTGAGGCGKTRLALRVAEHALKEYRDGVWFVDLASTADPSPSPSSTQSNICPSRTRDNMTRCFYSPGARCSSAKASR